MLHVKLGYASFSGRNMGTASDRTSHDNEGFGKLLVAADLPVMGKVVNASFTNNVSVADVETAGGKTSLAQNSLYGGFKNQFLNLTDNTQNVSFGTGNEKLGARIGYHVSEKANEFDSYNFDRVNDVESKGVYSSVNYKPTKNDALFMQSGMTVENGSFLGSKSNGAFALNPETKTYFTSMSYERSLTDNLTFLGNYNIGMTDLGVSQNSLVKNVTDAVSDSFALGLEYSNLLENDKVGISFSQPLRVRNASASVMLPMDILGNGDIVYDKIRTSIAPEGRELDLQGYYSADLDANSKVLFGSILRTEPDNVKDADNEALFVTKYSTKF